jgi:hypothetical protein
MLGRAGHRAVEDAAGHRAGPSAHRTDIAAARAELTGRGVEVSEIQVMGSPDMDGSKFAFFNDPDGNGWALQEIRARD